MKTRISIILCLSVCVQIVFGQTTTNTNIRAQYALNRLSDSGGLSSNETVVGISQPPGSVIGDVYYDSSFRSCAINLYKSDLTVKNIQVRYNLENQELELKHPLGLRILSSGEVKSFVWKNQKGNDVYFINAKDFRFNKSILVGFLEILYEGGIPLVKQSEVSFKKNQYIPALHAGNSNIEILKKEKFFFILNNELREVSSNKKKFAESFPEFQSDLLEYMNMNNISLKKEASLILTFDFINSRGKK